MKILTNQIIKWGYNNTVISTVIDIIIELKKRKFFTQRGKFPTVKKEFQEALALTYGINVFSPISLVISTFQFADMSDATRTRL